MDIEHLKAAIRIDRNDLDAELVRQPELVWHAANGFVLAVSRRDQSKDALKRVEAEAADRARKESDNAKPTVKEIEARIERDKFVIEKRKKLRVLSKKVNEWDAVKAAIHARGFALKNLVELVKLHMIAPRSDSEDYSRRAIREAGERIGKQSRRSKRRQKL